MVDAGRQACHFEQDGKKVLMEHHHLKFDPRPLNEVYWESQTAVVSVCDVETESVWN